MVLDEYISELKSRAQQESKYLGKFGDNPEFIGKLLEKQIDWICTMIHENIATDQLDRPYDFLNMFLKDFLESTKTIVLGGVLSPLTGDDDEWEDITTEDDKKEEFSARYTNLETGEIEEWTLPIESVQVNKRYGKIYRLNNDNRYAHRIDTIQFIDIASDKVMLTEDSIRFIKFPYEMNYIKCQVMVDNDTDGTPYVVNHLTFSTDEINGVLFYNASNPKKDEYVLLPKVPLDMIDPDGILIPKEIEKYNTMVETTFGEE